MGVELGGVDGCIMRGSSLHSSPLVEDRSSIHLSNLFLYYAFILSKLEGLCENGSMHADCSGCEQGPCVWHG